MRDANPQNLRDQSNKIVRLRDCYLQGPSRQRAVDESFR